MDSVHITRAAIESALLPLWGMSLRVCDIVQVVRPEDQQHHCLMRRTKTIFRVLQTAQTLRKAVGQAQALMVVPGCAV